MKSAFGCAVVFAALVCGAAPSIADVLISGSVTWGVSFTRTDFNGPNETLTFSFQLPNPTTASTTDISNAEFDLEGSPISETLTEVDFYSAPDGGLFDLHFDDDTILSFSGDDIGSTGAIQIGGPFAADVTIYGDQDINGSGTVTVTNLSAPPPAVPEPATLALLGAGLAGLARIRPRKRQA